MKLSKTIFILGLLIIISQSPAAAFYHILSGGGGGYQFNFFQAPAINDMIDSYNNQGKRKLWSELNSGSSMTDFNIMHGYFLRYAFYKYVDKSGSLLKTYQISAEFEQSFATSESSFEFISKNETIYRNFIMDYNSIALSFDWGFSPLKGLLLYGDVGIGYDHFTLESKLEFPDNLTYNDVIKYENDNFNTENTLANNKLKIQNGKFTGQGLSVKTELRAEYFITPQFETNISTGIKYIYIDRLKNDTENFRKNQFSKDPLIFESLQYTVRIGLNYYFVLE